MVKIILFLLPFCLTTKIGFAQKGMELGLSGGISIYQGEFTEDLIQLDDYKWATGFFARFNLAKRFSLKAGFNSLEMGASDLNSRTRKVRGWTFSGTANEFFLTGEVYLEDQIRPNAFSAFNPYLFAGLSYTRVDAKIIRHQDSSPYQPDLNDKDLFLMVPFGFGIKGRLTPSLRLGIEFGFRATFSDYVDDLISGKENNDWYSVFGANASYLFQKKRRRFEINRWY